MLYLNTNIFKKSIKLYKHSSKCDDQQQFKDIIGGAMVSTTEVFTDKINRSPMTPTPVNKPSARKSLCIFKKRI